MNMAVSSSSLGSHCTSTLKGEEQKFNKLLLGYETCPFISQFIMLGLLLLMSIFGIAGRVRST